MKKLLSITLSLALVLTWGMSTVSANTTDELAVAELTRSYLSASASAKYELTSVDLIADTVSELSSSEIAQLERNRSTRSADLSPLSATLSIDSQIGSYNEEKAEYIKYTRTQENLEITNYSVTYGNPVVTIDGNYAKVNIFETVGMRYAGLDEDSAISTNYEVDLIKTSDGWKIADIQSDDMFDKAHDREFDCAEAIIDYNTKMAQPASLILEQSAPDIESLEAAAAAAGAKIYNYNRQNAVHYSYQYTTSTGMSTRSYYNNNFNGYSADCMNFASQCVFAGFGGSDESPINTTAIPMDRVGSGTYNQWYKDSATWNGTLSFQSYCALVDHNNSKPAPTQNNLYVDVYKVGPTDAGIYDYTNRLPGAVVFVVDDDGDYGHALVIGKVTGELSSQIFVSAHTGDVKLQPLSQANWNGKDFRLVVPIAYYAHTNKPALRVVTDWKNNVPSGSSVTFNARAERLSGGTCYRMSMKVVSPSGVVSWLGERTNTNSYSATTTLSEKGLYKITAYARELSTSSSNVGNTIALRTY